MVYLGVLRDVVLQGMTDIKGDLRDGREQLSGQAGGRASRADGAARAKMEQDVQCGRRVKSERRSKLVNLEGGRAGW